MKALVVFSNFHLSHITAQPGIAYKLAQKMADSGHEVWILSNTEDKLIEKENGINLVLFRGLGDLQTYVRNMFSLLGTLWKVKPDVIHIHGHLLLVMFSFLSIFFRIPITFFSAETVDILTPFQKKLFVLALRSSKHIFVTSNVIKEEFAGRGVDPKKISISHIGVDDRFYRPVTSVPQDTDLLFFGDSRKERGFDIVVEIVKKLPKHLKILILLRWSTPEEIKPLKDLVNVTVLHHPYKHTLEHFIVRSKIVLLPFRFMGVRPPVSILEAMILERCIITSTMGGNEEIIENGKDGILDDFTDLAATHTRIMELLADNPRRSRMGKEGRRKILSLFSKNQYEKIISTIQQTIT